VLCCALRWSCQVRPFCACALHLTCENPPQGRTPFFLFTYLASFDRIVLAMSEYVISSVENLQLSSPLDTLVRTSSRRRRPNPTQLTLAQEGSSEASESQYIFVPTLDAPPKKSHHPPPSPLLHTRFRASVATQSSFNNSVDLSARSNSQIGRASRDADDISIYSTASDPHLNPDHLSTTLSDRHFSGGFRNLFQRSDFSPSSGTSAVVDGHSGDHLKNGAMDPYIHQRSPSSTSPSVPIVVVSEEPDILDSYNNEGWNASSSPSPDSHVFAGRFRSILPKNLNFSRPVKPGDVSVSETSKRQVLARNAFRSTLTQSNLQPSAQPSPPSRSGRTSPFEHGPSDSPSAPVPSAPFPSRPHVAISTNNPIPLLHEPPPLSPATSLYSMYSYYQLDSPHSPNSPKSDTLQVPPSSQGPPSRSPSPMRAQAPSSDLQKLDLADQLLQEGIQHHQANRLKEAAVAFERSATTPGGSGVGMLMWGLTLRHGWGCAKNESLGFTWLRRAAEAAVGDLERARSGAETSAVRGELVLAIYEVGQCFFHGWGVKKDQKMAVVSPWICLPFPVRFQSTKNSPGRFFSLILWLPRGWGM
jgi:hypothetical protein